MSSEKFKYELFNKFILRTPLWSLNIINNILKNKNYEDTRRELINFFSIPMNLEAIYIASGSLYKSLTDFIENPELLNEKKQKILIKSLYKYAARMCTRSTPFGLFAGCAVGAFADDTSLLLDAHKVDKFLMPDAAFLKALTTEILNNDIVREHLMFYPNPTAYKYFDKLRYIDYQELNTVKDYMLTSVDYSTYISLIFKKSQRGATISELSTTIIDDDINKNDARQFIIELIDSKLLIHELNTGMLAHNLSGHLQTFLNGLPLQTTLNIGKTERTVSDLLQTLGEINNFYAQGPGDALENLKKYAALSAKIDGLGITKADHLPVYKLDTFQHTKALNLQQNVLDSLLNFIHSAAQIETHYSNLNEFKKKFLARFDQQEVLLLKVLDTELGFNYPLFPAGEQIDVNSTPANRTPQSAQVAWNPGTRLMLEKYIETIKNNSLTAVITDAEIRQIGYLNKTAANLPSTLACLATVIKSNDPAIGQNIILKSHSPDAARMLLRFGYLNEKISDLVQTIVSVEEDRFDKRYSLAEINHTPSTVRYSNVVLRNNFYKSQIRLINAGNQETDGHIDLNDLYVSVKNNEVIIRSKKLNKIIVPKNSTALNPNAEKLSIYRFLEDVGNQFLPSIYSFKWPDFLSSNKFLPRLVYQNIILITASWTFSKSDALEILNADDSYNALAEWVTKWNIPRHVVFCEGDNELFIDFENLLSIEIFLGMLKDRDTGFMIKEFLETEENALITDEEGSKYCGQFLFVLKNDGIPKINRHVVAQKDVRYKPQRTFYPGSEWLYFKLYCTHISTNKILINSILPLCVKLKKHGLIDAWFFIRYGDPDYHLRVRLHISDKSRLHEVSALFYKAVHVHLVQDDIYKIQLDTYQREIERYRPELIDVAEVFFDADSTLSANVIKLFYKSAHEDTSLKYFAIQSIDSLLNDLDYDLEKKCKIIYDLAESFGNEFGKKQDKNLRNFLADQFKQHRESANQAISGKWPDEAIASKLKILLKQRSSVTSQCFFKLKSYSGKLSSPPFYNDIISSFIHMLMNKLFVTNQRNQEMLTYDLLFNVYKSNIERIKRNQFKNEAVSDLQ